ncbi:MAG: type II secretion system GspH family protein [Betaproteobacteria bacterium]|nr:type II secretion system GspH family protein [Betaproteobacteria bacterium]
MANSARETGAFTLLEVMLVMLVLAILLAGIAVPLATQVALRRHEETRRTLDEAREALLGFAAAHGRLPCPASAGSRGMESFAAGGDALNGNCSDFHGGYLPAAALGLASLDPEGFARDGWGTEANRIRYAVFGDGRALNGVTNPLTRANGVRQATLAALGDAPGFLVICGVGASAGPTGCGPAANQLTRRAALVLVSLGPNAARHSGPGTDESRNLDGDAVFVSHEVSSAPGNEFDDVLTWVPVHVLAGRMIAAGRLP